MGNKLNTFIPESLSIMGFHTIYEKIQVQQWEPHYTALHFLQGFFYGPNFVLKVNQSAGRIIDRVFEGFRYMNKNDPIIVIKMTKTTEIFLK